MSGKILTREQAEAAVRNASISHSTVPLYESHEALRELVRDLVEHCRALTPPWSRCDREPEKVLAMRTMDLEERAKAVADG